MRVGRRGRGVVSALHAWMLGALVLIALTGCSPRASTPEVVVYCAQDQVFGEPILDDFTKQTGIHVRARWDVESAKTTGLVNALVAEASSPRCDVFWNNEVAQTLYLHEKGVLEAYATPAREGIPASFVDPKGYWTGIAARARVILYNTEKVKAADVPRSVLDLVDARWRGRVAVARPLFGTTYTHAAALFQKLGDERALAYFDGLKANQVIVAEGNAHVRDLVAAGQAWIGLTDTDDANGALRAGKPVAVVFPDQQPDAMGTLVIPNTIMLIKGGPNAEAGRRLVDYLCGRGVEERLARGDSAQLPLHAGLAPPPGMADLGKVRMMTVDYADLGRRMPRVGELLRERFLR